MSDDGEPESNAGFESVSEHESGTNPESDRTRWNKKYRQSDAAFSLPDNPIPALEDRIDTLPDGRALDVATGTGRNARFVAAHGYTVDAVDISDEALAQAQAAAKDDGVNTAIEWIRADIADYTFEPGRYDVITISYFAALELLPDIKEALAPGGVLIYEQHLRSSDEIEIGPGRNRYRFRSNDLLRACLDLTILSYGERRRESAMGELAVATLIGRNSSGGAQSYPRLGDGIQ